MDENTNRPNYYRNTGVFRVNGCYNIPRYVLCIQAEKQRAELQGELNVLNERLESVTTSAQLQVHVDIK